ncbi:ubiquinol-cytochrome C chaperone family protein [Methylobacterium gnaphalii]|uniref:Ubiquinol-cytochrome c chaperone n=1 Tax=Methylobacterium gnaphalii TaxID=1010610 RepID=A0A512JNK6_9HYPH|nr:ubiquinol-cytochrome C chaperone family protein [Methylobacterium gnaphalii]GEP11540.1 ubiquinol-cytochrome c chaperone [Methylobacterium gnaphalii]
MILGFFRRAESRKRLVAGLHLRIDRAARAPGLYQRLQVPDTVEGRFEAVCLHVYLAMRRLKQLPPPAEDVAQDLINAVFAQFDASLRELGVGDVGVPKRMKKLAQAFYGRASGYDAALDAGDRTALAVALGRNVLGDVDGGQAGPLADYVIAADARLARASLDDLLGEGPLFPPPEDVKTATGAEP